MQLNVNRFWSDRLIFDETLPEKFRVANSFWDWCKRIISWIWSPASYSDENRRAIRCFRKYLIDTLGENRLQRICTRYALNFDAMEKQGSPLLSRDVAKIVIGVQNIAIEDVHEYIQKTNKKNFQELDAAALAQAIAHLTHLFADRWQVADIAQGISGRPTEWLARFFYDPFLADRERLQVSREHPKDSFETFMHNMVAYGIKREMDVGTLIPAPNRCDGVAQFYYVSAKLVTGEGMVSYILHPATQDTDLEPIRLFRGTAARNSEIDGISTLITDLEKDLGRRAYESGQIYESIIQEKLTRPTVEGGHSLGSTLVQYRLANMNHIRKAYLFCGPGLPEKEVEKFNRKNSRVTLIIRHSLKDAWCHLGDMHLGYQAPSHVDVKFWRYHPPRSKYGENPHVVVFGKKKLCYGIEGGICPEVRDAWLMNRHSHRERIRSTCGPIFAYALRSVRNCCRSYFSSRAERECGLKIGSLQMGRWRVDHFRPVAYNFEA